MSRIPSQGDLARRLIALDKGIKRVETGATLTKPDPRFQGGTATTPPVDTYEWVVTFTLRVVMPDTWNTSATITRTYTDDPFPLFYDLSFQSNDIEGGADTGNSKASLIVNDSGKGGTGDDPSADLTHAEWDHSSRGLAGGFFSAVAQEPTTLFMPGGIVSVESDWASSGVNFAGGSSVVLDGHDSSIKDRLTTHQRAWNSDVGGSAQSMVRADYGHGVLIDDPTYETTDDGAHVLRITPSTANDVFSGVMFDSDSSTKTPGAAVANPDLNLYGMTATAIKQFLSVRLDENITDNAGNRTDGLVMAYTSGTEGYYYDPPSGFYGVWVTTSYIRNLTS